MKPCFLKLGRSRSCQNLAKTCIFNCTKSGLDASSVALFRDTMPFYFKTDLYDATCQLGASVSA